MKCTSKSLIAVIVTIVCILSATVPAFACTGIRLTAADGTVIYARSMESALDFQSNIIVVPRGKQYVGTAPDNKPGLKWTTKYGFVGPNAFDLPYIADGLNEKGLAVGHFQFTGFAGFQTIEPKDAGQTIASFEVGTFLLGTCRTVREAIAALRGIHVCQIGTSPRDLAMGEFHYFVHDADGYCAVLEYVDGRLNVHENPIGVLTNSPPFDWQITNLRNYIHLDVEGTPPINLSGVNLIPFGHGGGLVGLPGDFTPPSRFVRAVVFTQAAPPTTTAKDCLLRAFHILNQFDIPAGSVRSELSPLSLGEGQGVERVLKFSPLPLGEGQGVRAGIANDEEGKPIYENTLWTSAADMKNLRYYFHTLQSRRIRMIDLRKLDLNAKDIKTISMHDPEQIDDLSTAAE